jgi:hypothetical protein
MDELNAQRWFAFVGALSCVSPSGNVVKRVKSFHVP